MQEKRAAARQALIEEQMALYHQALELRTSQHFLRNPVNDMHQAKVMEQQELLMQMADAKVGMLGVPPGGTSGEFGRDLQVKWRRRIFN